MPNTLAHLGAQGIMTRYGWPSVDPRWILLGCVIPDVPWIMNRVLLAAFPGMDAHELRLYVIAQASLLCCLLLCGALAALTRAWRPVLAVLSANALLHLLLDACQTKWGNGVHLLAPWSWVPWNLELFWPESMPTYLLTTLGLGFGLWALHFSWQHAFPCSRPSGRRALLSTLLLITYLVLPALLRDGPERADSHSVRTLRDRQDRAGRRVELDRARFVRVEDGRTLMYRGDEQILVLGAGIDHSARVSARGRFLDAETLLVDELHEHRGWPRDVASYVGLGLVAAAWGAGLMPRRPGTRGAMG